MGKFAFKPNGIKKKKHFVKIQTEMGKTGLLSNEISPEPSGLQGQSGRENPIVPFKVNYIKCCVEISEQSLK